MRTAEEIFKSITEFGTGLHFISSWGRVIRGEGFLKTGSGFRYVREMELKLSIRDKYLSIPRVVNGVTKNFPIHILVAKYFVPNPNKKPDVNHLDGDKFNNNDWNLAWATRSENELHSYRVLGKKPNKTALGKKDSDNKLSKKIKCVETGIVYNSLGSAAKDNKVSRSLICLVVNGKQKTANKRTFKYV